MRIEREKFRKLLSKDLLKKILRKEKDAEYISNLLNNF